MDTRPLHASDCFAAHNQLADRAHALSRYLRNENVQESDILRLGAVCLQIAAEQALAAREERQAIRSWVECEIGEMQIRGATYRALAHGHIGNPEYDVTFRAAMKATRARREELLRLRRRLRQLAVI
jgi:hypothetical protein